MISKKHTVVQIRDKVHTINETMRRASDHAFKNEIIDEDYLKEQLLIASGHLTDLYDILILAKDTSKHTCINDCKNCVCESGVEGSDLCYDIQEMREAF